MEEAWLANCFGAMIVWKTPLPGAKGRQEKSYPPHLTGEGPLRVAKCTKPCGYALRSS